MEKTTWEFINTFAPWLSAIGTIAAVIVSLYLSGQERRIKLQVSAQYDKFVGILGNKEEYLGIHVVNIGRREAEITVIGWKVGLLKKREYLQRLFFRDEEHDIIPKRLKDGEQADYYIPLPANGILINKFINDILKPHQKLNLNSLKIVVNTSVGKQFQSKINKSLRDEITEHINAQKKGIKNDV